MSLSAKDIHDLICIVQDARKQLDTRSKIGQEKAQKYDELANALLYELDDIEICFEQGC